MNVGVDRAEEHASFVAGADHAHPQRRADRLLVAEVERAQAAAHHHARGDAPHDEVAPRDAALDGRMGFRHGIHTSHRWCRSSIECRIRKTPRDCGRGGNCRDSHSPRPQPRGVVMTSVS